MASIASYVAGASPFGVCQSSIASPSRMSCHVAYQHHPSHALRTDARPAAIRRRPGLKVWRPDLGGLN
jgi:hypothetical protein